MAAEGVTPLGSKGKVKWSVLKLEFSLWPFVVLPRMGVLGRDYFRIPRVAFHS